MLAVIKTGGKQYVVSEGTKLKIEKLEAEVGKEVIFDQVLLLMKPASASSLSLRATAGEANLEIGMPLVEGAKVSGKVLTQGKADKVIAFKYKAKKRYHVKKGHRQQYTEVEITKVV